MLAAGLALAASVAWGAADFLGGIKSRQLPLLTLLLLSQPAGLALVAAVVAVRGPGPPGPAVLWAVPAAVFGTCGIAAFYRGMALGAMSIVAPIASTAAAVPVIIGVASGDRPSAAQAAGFVLALAGVVLSSRDPGGPARRRVAAGAGWALLAALGFGGYYLPMHAASGADALWAALIFRATAATGIAIAWLAVRPPLAGARAEVRALVTIGLLDTGGTILFAAAASRGLVSVVSVLASLYPVTTVALARFTLRERIGRVQEAGVAVALAGVVLISAG